MTRFALSLLLTAGFATPALAGQTHLSEMQWPSALPPVSNPGECYAQVRIPAQYAQGSQQVVTQEAHATLAVTEPQLRSRTEQVLTKEASIRYEVRQPQYRSISEQIVTRPAHDRLSVSPPQFQTVTEALSTSPSHLVWKRGNPGELRRQGYRIHSTADGRLRDNSGYSGGSYGTTQQGGDACGPGCEIWCLVEEPGEVVGVTTRRVIAPPRVTRTPVPAQTRTLIKQVLTDPGGVREIPVPAEYAAVTVQDLVRPAEAYEVNVPAEYGQVATRQLISPERYEWRRVLCAPGTAPGTAPETANGTAPVSERYRATHQSAPLVSTPRPTYGGYKPRPSQVPQPTQPRTGYYGTENHPAYRR